MPHDTPIFEGLNAHFMKEQTYLIPFAASTYRHVTKAKLKKKTYKTLALSESAEDGRKLVTVSGFVCFIYILNLVFTDS